jgi:hypothetical protein
MEAGVNLSDARRFSRSRHNGLDCLRMKRKGVEIKDDHTLNGPPKVHENEGCMFMRGRGPGRALS